MRVWAVLRQLAHPDDRSGFERSLRAVHPAGPFPTSFAGSLKRTSNHSPFTAAARPRAYGVVIKPLLVATIQRLPHRTIESIVPSPGTLSPRVTFQTPSGPCSTALPLATSRITQPSMVVGFVSGNGVGCVFGLLRTVDNADGFFCWTTSVALLLPIGCTVLWVESCRSLDPDTGLSILPGC